MTNRIKSPHHLIACPLCGSELRPEFPHGGGHFGYCSRCAVNHELCQETKYMDICSRKKGHDGQHIAANGLTWWRVPTPREEQQDVLRDGSD